MDFIQHVQPQEWFYHGHDFTEKRSRVHDVNFLYIQWTSFLQKFQAFPNRVQSWSKQMPNCRALQIINENRSRSRSMLVSISFRLHYESFHWVVEDKIFWVGADKFVQDQVLVVWRHGERDVHEILEAVLNRFGVDVAVGEKFGTGLFQLMELFKFLCSCVDIAIAGI